MEVPLQLTLEVGGARPDAASLKLGGQLRLHSELAMGAELMVRVIGPDGELLAEGEGEVIALAFRRHQPTNGREWVERQHQVTLR